MCKPHSSNHFLLSECCSKIIGLFNDNTIMKRVRNCSIFMSGGIEEFSGNSIYLGKGECKMFFPQYWRAKRETYVYKKKKKKKTGFKRGHKHFCPKCRKMQNVYAKIYENNTFLSPRVNIDRSLRQGCEGLKSQRVLYWFWLYFRCPFPCFTLSFPVGKSHISRLIIDLGLLFQCILSYAFSASCMLFYTLVCNICCN